MATCFLKVSCHSTTSHNFPDTPSCVESSRALDLYLLKSPCQLIIQLIVHLFRTVTGHLDSAMKYDCGDVAMNSQRETSHVLSLLAA
jgi:hypothetical protein